MSQITPARVYNSIEPEIVMTMQSVPCRLTTDGKMGERKRVGGERRRGERKREKKGEEEKINRLINIDR